MHGKHEPFKMKSHVYYTHEGQEMAKDMEDMGCDVEAVDPFGGYVASSKDDDQNLNKAEETIRERFQLE